MYVTTRSIGNENEDRGRQRRDFFAKTILYDLNIQDFYVRFCVMGPSIVMRGRGAWRGNEIKVLAGLGRGLPACRTAGGCLRLVVGLLIVMPGTDRGLFTVMPKTDRAFLLSCQGLMGRDAGARGRDLLSRSSGVMLETCLVCIVGLLIVVPRTGVA